MADKSNEHSGSRWEPQADEQTTEYLAGPAEPTEVLRRPRRLPKVAAAVAVVAAATIAGGAIGLAVAGNRTEPAGDTATISEQGTAPDGSTGTFDRDSDRPHGFGHHGPGRH